MVVVVKAAIGNQSNRTHFATAFAVFAKAVVEEQTMETVVVERSVQIVGFVTQLDCSRAEHFESFHSANPQVDLLSGVQTV